MGKLRRLADLIGSRKVLKQEDLLAIRGVTTAENERPKVPTHEHKSLEGNLGKFLDRKKRTGLALAKLRLPGPVVPSVKPAERRPGLGWTLR